jgi:hypothetical protein
LLYLYLYHYSVKKVLFIGFIVCNYIDILPFTYFSICKGFEMCLQYYYDP